MRQQSGSFRSDAKNLHWYLATRFRMETTATLSEQTHGIPERRRTKRLHNEEQMERNERRRDVEISINIVRELK